MRKVAMSLMAAFVVAAFTGCGPKTVDSTDVKAPDPYAGMSKEEKIEAIRNDPKITTMQRESMIADIQADRK
jgi:hypothetical protein